MDRSGIDVSAAASLVVLALTLPACQSYVVERQYDEPYPYVLFAAREAVVASDFREPRRRRSENEIRGSRRASMAFGLIISTWAGGEGMRVNVVGDERSAKMSVESQRRFGLSWLFQQDFSEIVASAVDRYLEENRDARAQILAQAGMHTPPEESPTSAEPTEQTEEFPGTAEPAPQAEGAQ